MSNKNVAASAKPRMNPGVLGRVIKMLIRFYPVLIPVTAVCIILSAVVSSIPAIFTQKVFAILKVYIENGNLDWNVAKAEILPLVAVLAVLYVLSIALITCYTQLMAFITQGFLDKLRTRMFDGMQNLPVKYFDTHKHGDIMSYYTNDIDALRELVSGSLPQVLSSSVIVITVLGIMLWYSIPMTLVVILGIVAMVFVSRKIGGG